jgi:hypothetical protein
MIVLMSGPRFLSSTERFHSRKRDKSEPYTEAWSCKSHSPPWSQMGQSNGWLDKRNSITPSRALATWHPAHEQPPRARRQRIRASATHTATRHTYTHSTHTLATHHSQESNKQTLTQTQTQAQAQAQTQTHAYTHLWRVGLDAHAGHRGHGTRCHGLRAFFHLYQAHAAITSYG